MWRVLHFHHLIANEASFYVTIDCPLKGGVETYLSTFSYVIRDRPPACEADPSTPHRKYNFQLPNSEEVSAYMHILSCTYDGGWTSRWAITISTNHTYLVVLTMGGGRLSKIVLTMGGGRPNPLYGIRKGEAKHPLSESGHNKSF